MVACSGVEAGSLNQQDNITSHTTKKTKNQNYLLKDQVELILKKSSALKTQTVISEPLKEALDDRDKLITQLLEQLEKSQKDCEMKIEMEIEKVTVRNN